MAQVAFKTCDICASAPERHFCIDCEQCFCENCKGLHTRQKTTRHHEFQESSQMKIIVNNKCEEHGEDYIFICETCNVPVCSRCMVGNHNRHRVSNIREKFAASSSIVKDEIAEKLQEDTRILNELEKGIDTYDCQVKSVINGIKEDEIKIKQVIDDIVKKMIDDVTMKTTCEKDILVNLVAATKSRIETATALEDRRKHLDTERKNVAVIFDMKTLHQDISKIQIGVPPSFPSIEYKQNVAPRINFLSCFGTYASKPPKYKESPERYEKRTDKNGRSYIVDHHTRTTSWDLSKRLETKTTLTDPRKKFAICNVYVSK
ncbi:tripartite motif-containing protein 45-like [Mytilus californianus]|uniref:tripartite motif-containing protein 45-like n=1 Tax=Mytilus californianus TaxID=6549 RepID=UPI002246473C|nr:tripartite motif-containing protein 45-like [Mytilus californianus]